MFKHGMLKYDHQIHIYQVKLICFSFDIKSHIFFLSIKWMDDSGLLISDQIFIVLENVFATCQ